jgi:predicted esterase
MMRSQILLLPLLTFAFQGLLAAAPRAWKSSDGGASFQGTLESADETNVKIKRASDFKTFTFPIEKLSPDDQTYVRGIVNEQRRDAGLKTGPFAAQIKGEFAKGTSPEGLNYQLYGNPKWDAKLRYPLVIFLHGSGESGSNNQAQMGGVTKIFTREENQKQNPCFMLVPQCPSSDIGWSNDVAENVVTLVKRLRTELPIDEGRIYLTGYSMGAFGSFGLAVKHPDVWAAIVPLAGGGDAKKAEVLKSMPIWAFHGDKDDQVPVERTSAVMKAITAAGGTVGKYTELTGEGHGIPGLVYERKDLHEWLFAQKRPSTAASD